MPRPPKITNEEILAAARQVFLAEGINGSTLEIGQKAGISEASIFVGVDLISDFDLSRFLSLATLKHETSITVSCI
jgi:hypothetical protein